MMKTFIACMSILVLLSCTACSAHRNQTPLVSTILDDLDVRGGGMAVDRAGNFFIADFKGDAEDYRAKPNGKIVSRVTPDGTVTVLTQEAAMPTTVTLAPNGDLYISNAKTNSIDILGTDGTVRRFASVPWPGAIVFDEAGNVYTPSYINESRTAFGRSIYKITPQGEVSEFLRSDLLLGPVGLVRDDAGYMYVSNWEDRKILRISPNGTFEHLATIPGAEGEFIAEMVRVGDDLYVAGFSSHRIFRVSLTGEVEVFAGTGEPGHQDGPLLSATFNNPNGIAASADGDALYVTDAGGSKGRLRKIVIGN